MTEEVDLEYTWVTTPWPWARALHMVVVPPRASPETRQSILRAIDAFLRDPQARSVTVRVELNKR